MSACIGCTCTRPAALRTGGSLLLATRVAHHVAALRSLVREQGGEVHERTPGVLEITTGDVAGLVVAAQRQLTSVEAAEVRAVQLEGQAGDDLLALAMVAPTLAQLGARAQHADLMPLFADELNAFRAVYQPIVSLREDDPAGAPQVVGHEALLRATGAQGPVMPQELFGAAEQAGWLHVLDRVGRTTALRGAQGWLGDDLLFVNFLPTTIYRPEVCLRTTEIAAERAGLRLEQLVFEVTESERITDLDHLAHVFAYYRERGCRVALDDLGAGYSSLNMLVRLQPDIVKLDKDIVQGLPDAVSAAVVSAVVEITHAYGGQVLAECVETQEQADCARELGVDLGQGWFWGRPVERGPVPATASTTASTPPSTTAPAPARAAVAPVTPAVVEDAAAFAGNDPAVSLDAPTAPAARPASSAAEADPAPSGPDASVPHTLVPDAPLPAELRGSADVEALLARAVEVTTSGVTIADATLPDMPLVYVNQAFTTATGYTAGEVLGRNCRFLQGPDTDRDVVAGLREAVRAGRDHVALLRNHRKDGTPWWNELRLSPVRDVAGRTTHYFGFQLDVTERVEAQRAATHLADHDPLTGLANRPRLLRALEERTAAGRLPGTAWALLFIDLDGFKDVNDSFGHEAGDRVLAEAARRLRAALGPEHLVARYGGDEFVVVMADAPEGEVERLAEAAVAGLTAALESPVHDAAPGAVVGASTGVAVFPLDGATAHQLLRSADHAMFAAKTARRAQRPAAVRGEPVLPRGTAG